MKTVEITQLQPVAQVPRVLVVEKTTEIPQFEVDDKVVDVPVETASCKVHWCMS